VTWREQYATPPPAEDLVFLGWLDGARFLSADNEGFWYLFSEVGYEWRAVWGRKS